MKLFCENFANRAFLEFKAVDKFQQNMQNQLFKDNSILFCPILGILSTLKAG